MPPSNAMENDKKRLRNQFSKDERTRLLTIMTEYGPLLDDKNISILSRKEIWEIIENKFNENGHSGRTSAQLKKYWQNYKYHSKRTKIIHHKEVPKPLSPMTKHMVRMLAKVNPEEWAQYDVAVNVAPTQKSPGSSKSSPTPNACANANNSEHDRKVGGSSPVSETPVSPPLRSSKLSIPEEYSSASDAKARPESSGIRGGSKKDISESNVVVATTDVPGSSVTVSVFCPEVPSKARTIFWKRNMPVENVGPINYVAAADSERSVIDKRNSPDRFGSNFGNSDISNEVVTGDTSTRRTNIGHRLNVVGMLAGNKSERSASDRSDNLTKKCAERYHKVPTVGDHRLSQSVATPVEKLIKNQPSIRETEVQAASRLNKSDSFGNLSGAVKETPAARTDLSKDYHSMETLGSLATTNSGNDTAMNCTDGGVPNSSTSCPEMSQERGASVVSAEFDEMMQQFASAAAKESLNRTLIPDDVKDIMETLSRVRNLCNFEGDPTGATRSQDAKRELDIVRCFTNRNKDSSTQDFLWLKFYLMLLRGFGQPGGGLHLDIMRKFEPLISKINSTVKGNGDNEESSDSDRAESEEGMEVDESGTNLKNGAGKLRVRRVSLMTPPIDGGEQFRHEIKVETEAEPEAGNVVQNLLNDIDNIEGNRVMNSMNYLVQAKLQCAKSELDHQLKLQKLEMEEKELRVRIAETAIQEARLRIQALIEERLRATELHELRIAQMAAEKARSEAEHTARLDASCTATAESHARISSIERDRERAENFYQMQLRCMSAGSANGNGLKCKQYEQ